LLGFAGACLLGALSRTDPPIPEPLERDAEIASVNEVNMKMMAAQVVALVSALAAERGPKAV